MTPQQQQKSKILPNQLLNLSNCRSIMLENRLTQYEKVPVRLEIVVLEFHGQSKEITFYAQDLTSKNF